MFAVQILFLSMIVYASSSGWFHVVSNASVSITVAVLLKQSMDNECVYFPFNIATNVTSKESMRVKTNGCEWIEENSSENSR